jgi:hypothetical protein
MKSIRKGFLFLGVMLALIGLNWFLFRWFGSRYFLWYLNNGPIISLASGFLAPTWTKLKARLGLVSAHPAVYFGACLQILGVFFVSMAQPMRRANKSADAGIEIELGDGPLMKLSDNLLYPLLIFVMGILSFAWVILVAPLSYFVTLIAGVPARQSLRGNLISVAETSGQVRIGEAQTDMNAVRDPAFTSFAQDPFATTQALTALVLFVANIVYARIT